MLEYSLEQVTATILPNHYVFVIITFSAYSWLRTMCSWKRIVQ